MDHRIVAVLVSLVVYIQAPEGIRQHARQLFVNNTYTEFHENQAF